MQMVAALSLAVLMSGCAQLGQVSDDDLAHALEVGSKNAVKYSLRLALRKVSPEEAQRIAKDAQAADFVISKNILPIFSGAQTAAVVRSAVDTALLMLKDKVTNPKVIAAIDLGVEVIVMEIALPKNPAEKLDERTTKAILAVFTGISSAIQSAFPAPADAPPPAPAREVMSLPK